MKKTLLLLCFLCLSIAPMNAQTPLTEAVDFDVTFTNGEAFNLFDKLAEDKYVVVDFFFTTCGPCIDNQGYFTEAYQNFGCNTGDIYFLSIESTVDDAATIQYEETYAGDNAPHAASGTEGNGIAVTNAYSIGAAPTFILIAPDGTILEQDMWPLTNASTFTGYFNSHGLEERECQEVSSGIDEQFSETVLDIFPNPAESSVSVSLAAFEGTATIGVYDVTGKQVHLMESDNDNVVIDLTDISNGVYVLKVENEGHYSTTRLVVSK